MDESIKILIKRVIKDELGTIISAEITQQFEPIKKQVDLIRKENRDSYDNISTQLTEDRRDIDTILTSQAKSEKQNEVIIKNQKTQEDKVVKVIEDATADIPEQVKKAVNKTMGNESFMDKILG